VCIQTKGHQPVGVSPTRASRRRSPVANRTASGEILVSNHGVPARIKRDWHSHQRHVVCQHRWRESAAAGALALCRFVTGPEATLATPARGRAVPPGRLHPPIHIKLCSGIPGKQGSS